MLFVTPNLPFPAFGGPRIRDFYWLKYLTTQMRVTLFVLKEPTLAAGDLRNLLPLDDIRIIESDQNISIRKLFGGFRFPEWCQLYHSQQASDDLNRLLGSNSFDYIHASHTYLAPYFLPYAETENVLIDHHNVKSQLFAECTKYSTGLQRAKMALETRKWTWLENSVLPQFQRHSACSVEDAMAIQAKINRRVFHVPNVIDVPSYDVSVKDIHPQTLLFTGDLTYFPNGDALRYFLKSIFPLIVQAVPGVRLKVVGKKPPLRLRKLLFAHPNIDYAYDVPDVKPYLRKSALLIAPLRIGSGTRLKIIEAMAASLPVVSSQKAAEGIEVGEHCGVFIHDDAQAFAKQVIALLKDRREREKAGSLAKEHALRNFHWSNNFDALKAAYPLDDEPESPGIVPSSLPMNSVPEHSDRPFALVP